MKFFQLSFKNSFVIFQSRPVNQSKDTILTEFSGVAGIFVCAATVSGRVIARIKIKVKRMWIQQEIIFKKII